MSILISGASSGLGKFFHEELASEKFNRSDNIKKYLEKNFSTIIHCAFNLKNKVTCSDYKDYIRDTIILTENLLKIPHKKFIFISTIDVYPKKIDLAEEDSDFDIEHVEGIYAKTKLICENLVRNSSANFAILRPSAILGKYSKKNSLMKILDDQKESITLSAKSSFNYVLYGDILRLVQIIIKQDLQGIYNIAASSNIQLSDITKKYKTENINFGKFCYETPKISISKLITTDKFFNKSSMQNIESFKAHQKGPLNSSNS